MNHIYRLIWNTTLACWVVASEHTRDRGKATRAGRAMLTAATLALAMPALADDDMFTEQDEDVLSSAIQELQLRLYNEAMLRGGAADPEVFSANRVMNATVNDIYFANPTLSGENSLALGSRAYVAGNRSTAIGNEAVADGGGHTVLGSKATARGGKDGVAIGINALANGTGTVVIGEAAQATYDHAIAVGRQAKAYGTGAVVLGNEAHALGYSNAIGHQANANNSWANAIGFQAKAQAAGSSAIGYKALAGSIATVAMGWEAKANAPYSLAFGYAAEVNGTAADSIAMGRDSKVGANARQALAVGMAAQASGASSIALGHLANAGHASSIALGTEANATGNQSLAVGLRSKANGQTAMALGMDAQALGNYTTALGHQAKAGSAWTNAIGYQAEATGVSAVAIGSLANAAASTSVAVGDRAKVDAAAVRSIALGNYATVNAEATNAVALGYASVASAANTVSVGSASLKRKIVNLADGEISATSSDAVTGKQLHAVNNRLDGQSVALGENARPNGGRAIAIGYNALVPTNGGVDGIAVGTNARGGSGGWTGGIAIGGAATADYDGLALGYDTRVSASSAVAVGRGSTANVANTVSVGSDTIKRKIVNVADGALAAASTDAVTGKQLFATNQNVSTATNIANTAKVTADAARIDATAALDKATIVSGLIGQVSSTGNVRLGGENTGTVVDVRNRTNASRKISGVADGALSASSTEAVAGKQLFATNQNVTLATSTANAAKTSADAAQIEATAALDKANALNGLVSQAAPNGAVRLGGENAGIIVDVRNSNGGARTLSGVAAGALHATSSEAVNGAQLSAVNGRVELHSVAIGVNRLEIGMNRDGLDELREAFDNFEPDLSGVVRYNEDRSLVDLEGAGVAGLAAGEISAGSREAINGSQLFGTNERVGYLEHQQRYVMVGTDELSEAAQAGIFGVAVGGDAKARAEGATAVGSFASALGRNSVALGRGSYVAPDATNGFALGTRTNVESVGGMAIGADSDVMIGADRSVALGNASVATEANTVSLGNDGLKRRLVNMARGTRDDNGTTLIQLREAVTALGGGATIDAAGNVIAPRYSLSGGNFNNVGDALTSIDTKLVSHKGDLDTLDTRYKALVQNDRSIRYNDDRSVVDFGGARLTGVANGHLEADSKDAVNGGQLFSTNQRVGELEQREQFIAIGTHDKSAPALAGDLGLAVGGDSKAIAEGATALGNYSSALAINSIALGRGSYVAAEAVEGFAFGSRSHALAEGAIAIGAASRVEEGASHAVALGRSSIAAEANTVSLGNDNLKRRIVNVAQGIRANDATTVSQLRGALSALGGGADLDANGNVIGPRYAVQGSEYGSFGDAITALDGSVGDNKRNLDTLDSRFQRLFQESPLANADGSGRLSFGGAQGMVLGNVANGLIGQGSRDAVNGGQLWAVKEDLQGQIDALDPGKGEVSGLPLAMNARSGSITPSADGGSQLAPPDATPPAADPGTVVAQDQLVKAEGDNAVAVGSEGKERQVKHVAEGRADTDAANVRQVNDALDRANAYTDSAVASVNQRLDQVDKRINRMAAISSAQSAMAMNTAGLATANRLGAGVGYSEGESAMAVGYQRVLTERGSATFSLNGAFTNSGEKSVGVGVGIGW